MYHVSKRGVLFIQRFEGFRAQPYRCPAEYHTIGYGHVLKKNEQYQELDLEEATEILHEDLRVVSSGIARNTTIALKQHQFDALASLVFNIGIGAYQRSTLRAKLNREEHDEVIDEFQRWIFVGNSISRGLLHRREAEAKLYRDSLY